ncbi:MAG TPA: ABC transporter substrate-binding protein [Chloroflexota bacterium]|jgi:NitT/TauT family transport system substrate-binding protein|nr:ABC transporter substrate-binding protein [Chloroflexota bacterium]
MPTAAPTARTGRPVLPATPLVTLQVGVLPVASWGPLFIARERGYLKEVGLEVEVFNFSNYAEQLPLIAQGRLQVAGCANAVVCFNAFGRQIDVQIVADIQSAGKTEKSMGASALVVRRDLWEDGTIRTPHDLLGRSVYTQAGPGSGQQAMGARWLIRYGLDPRSVEWPMLTFPDLFASMQNRGAEVGFQSEPFVTAGVTRGVHHVLATQEEMYPTIQTVYLMYWTGLDQLGPMVGERFMIAYLRGGRDFLNAMEYGIDQDAVIDLLTRETTIKDPAVYRQIKYPWHDPDGVVAREALQADIDLFHELGLMDRIDISRVFEDKYRRFAIEYLGTYQPPR